MTDVELRHGAPGAGVDASHQRADDPAPRSRLGATRLALLCGLLYLPFTVFGYGTDVDITNLLRSGRSLLDGNYHYARPPGALPYEALVGVLDRIGGPTAINLASALMATATLVILGRLVSRELGDRAGVIAVLVVGTQPWFWVAATSLGDYVFALGLLLAGILAARHDRRIVAGLAFATAIGFRSGTVLLVWAYLLAEVVGRPDGVDGPPPSSRDRWRGVVITAATTVAVGVLWFIPPWLSVGRTGRFLMNEFETTGVVATIGRWGVKNIAFFGVFTLAVLLVRAPVLVAALGRFRTSTLVRAAVLVAVAAEALFLRFPWKPVHLLPTIVCVAILLAASPRTTNRLVGAVVVTQLLLAVVSVTIAEPDDPNAATTGRVHLGVTWGVVVNELDCRIDPPFDGTWPDIDTPAADYAAIDVFTCQARSWRPGGIPPDYGEGSSS